jgi:preprotein translocase subunit SecA
VSLRSLEQKSPLNIYVEEADKYFNEMKLNVARNCIIALHRMYIPNAANKLKDTLIATMPALFLETVKREEIANDANNASLFSNTTLSDIKINK